MTVERKEDNEVTTGHHHCSLFTLVQLDHFTGTGSETSQHIAPPDHELHTQCPAAPAWHGSGRYASMKAFVAERK